MQLLAENRGVEVDAIEPDARLLHDLGMDGDDAVDFFVQVGGMFSTDLSELFRHWSEHFNGEGTTLRECAGLLIPTGLGMVTAPLLHLGRSLALSLLFVILWSWALRCWPLTRKPKLPIMVADVLEAVRGGRWAVPYDGSRRPEAVGYPAWRRAKKTRTAPHR